MRVVAFINEHEVARISHTLPVAAADLLASTTKVCEKCGVVDKILRHLERREEGRGRGPPGSGRAQAAS